MSLGDLYMVRALYLILSIQVGQNHKEEWIARASWFQKSSKGINFKGYMGYFEPKQLDDGSSVKFVDWTRSHRVLRN